MRGEDKDKVVPYGSAYEDVHAIILFADIIDSSKYAERCSLKEYESMIREFHQIAEEIVDKYCSEFGIPDKNIYKRAHGDEVLIILHTGDTCLDFEHILKISVLVKNSWIHSEFNSKRTDESKEFQDIRIGIGEGKVRFRQSIWRQKRTPEGYPITQTKRIESKASSINQRELNLTPIKDGTNDGYLLGLQITPPGGTNIIVKGTLRGCLKGNSGKIKYSSTQKVYLEGLEPIEVFAIIEFGELLNEVLCLEIFREIPRREMGKYSEKLADGNSAILAGNFKNAEESYIQALEIKNDSSLAHQNIAVALMKQGKFEESLKHYEIARKSDDENAMICNNMGNVYAAQGAFDKAVEFLSKAIDLDPEEYYFYSNRGASLSEMGKWNEAISDFKKAIDLNPNEVRAYYNIGYMYYKMGKYTDSIKFFKNAIKIEGTFAPAHSNLGLVLKILKFYHEAEEELQIAKQLDPLSFATTANLAELFRKTNDHKKAIKAYKEVIKIDDSHSKIHYNLGTVLQESSDKTEILEEAVRCYRRSLELEPDFYLALVNLGSVLGKLGKYKESAELSRRAITIQNDDEIPHMNLAKALRQMGRIDKPKNINQNITDL